MPSTSAARDAGDGQLRSPADSRDPVYAAEVALQHAQEHEGSGLEALYWATVGCARATLAVAEELRRSREGVLTKAEKAALAPPLTSRELEILKLLAKGRTNAEIADQLNLSHFTVKDYAASLYRKLGARNRTEAVRVAGQFGLIE